MFSPDFLSITVTCRGRRYLRLSSVLCIEMETINNYKQLTFHFHPLWSHDARQLYLREINWVSVSSLVSIFHLLYQLFSTWGKFMWNCISYGAELTSQQKMNHLSLYWELEKWFRLGKSQKMWEISLPEPGFATSIFSFFKERDFLWRGDEKNHKKIYGFLSGRFTPFRMPNWRENSFPFKFSFEPSATPWWPGKKIILEITTNLFWLFSVLDNDSYVICIIRVISQNMHPAMIHSLWS